MEPSDYAWLLNGLDETREHLRTIKVFGEQRKVQMAWAFYRVEAAAAVIRELLEISTLSQGVQDGSPWIELKASESEVSMEPNVKQQCDFVPGANEKPLSNQVRIIRNG